MHGSFLFLSCCLLLYFGEGCGSHCVPQCGISTETEREVIDPVFGQVGCGSRRWLLHNKRSFSDTLNANSFYSQIQRRLIIYFSVEPYNLIIC